MLRIILVHPGATDYDDQRRIKGNLNLPLSANGKCQVQRIVAELHDEPLTAVYSAPCDAAVETARAIGADHQLQVKQFEKLANLDLGLWHGKLIDEVKQNQPKLYRQRQDHPETVCPPQGETLESAQQRIQPILKKLLKRNKSGTVAIVAPQPCLTLIRCQLTNHELGDLWKAECETGGWDVVEVQSSRSLFSAS